MHIQIYTVYVFLEITRTRSKDIDAALVAIDDLAVSCCLLCRWCVNNRPFQSPNINFVTKSWIWDSGKFWILTYARPVNLSLGWPILESFICIAVPTRFQIVRGIFGQWTCILEKYI